MDAIGEEGGVRRRQGMKEAKEDGERGGREASKKRRKKRRRKEKWRGLGDIDLFMKSQKIFVQFYSFTPFTLAQKYRSKKLNFLCIIFVHFY